MTSLHFNPPNLNNTLIKISFLNTADSATLNKTEIYQLKQIHSANFVKLSEFKNSSITPEADGIIVENFPLNNSPCTVLIKSADCLPIFFIDYQNEVVVAMHAGWRGVLKNFPFLPFTHKICDPEHTKIWVGPSLSGKSFVVREDMWALFGETSHNRKYFENVEGNNDEKHFHVWKYVEDVWLSMGVKEVKNVRINTYENENFSSWRRDFQAGFFKPRANNYSLITFS